MNSTILEQLWNGQIAPYRNVEQNDPEIAELLELVRKNRESLEAHLDVKQKNVLEKLLHCQNDYYYLLMIQAFRMGFALSTQLSKESTTIRI